MRALTFQGLRSIALDTVPDPAIEGPTDAVVRVELAGICGSDLHVYHGRERGLDRGTVMGHEFVGTVVACGREVTGFKAGDRVLSPFTTSCGACFHCRRGLTARCSTGQLYGWVEHGRGLHGAQAELVRVPLADSTLVKIPEGLSDDEALLLGDVAPTGYHGAERAGLEPGGTHVVLGCGPIGLLAVVGAIELGRTAPFAVDAVPGRLALAARFGARPLDLGAGGVVEAVQEATAGRGADAVIECVGSSEALRLAFQLVRAGGTISSVGVHTAPAFSFSPVEAYDKNLTYRTGRCPARAVLETLVPLVGSRRHDLASILSHRMPLERGPAGYDLFDRRADGCIKVALLPGARPS